MSQSSHISLKGKRALVTAASRGIGAGIAIGLSRAGAAVAVNFNRDEQAAREIVACCDAHGHGHVAVRGDALQEASSIWAAASEEMGGAPDILVCNYGPFSFGKLSEMPAEEFEDIVCANLFSAHRMVARALPDLRPGGTIILIGLSCVADELQAAPNVAPYAIGKAALTQYGRSLAAEVASEGVRVAVVAPGLIDNGHLTEIQKQWMIERVPVGRLGRPEEVADAVCFLCSDLASYCSGSVLTVSGGWRWSEDRNYRTDELMERGADEGRN